VYWQIEPPARGASLRRTPVDRGASTPAGDLEKSLSGHASGVDWGDEDGETVNVTPLGGASIATARGAPRLTATAVAEPAHVYWLAGCGAIKTVESLEG